MTLWGRIGEDVYLDAIVLLSHEEFIGSVFVIPDGKFYILPDCGSWLNLYHSKGKNNINRVRQGAGSLNIPHLSRL